jgi:II/X family phage/plasmid replication protein
MHLGDAQRAMLNLQTDRIQRVTSEGELSWETGCWDSLRSDMNGLAYCVGSSLRLGGSPASVLRPNNVFGPSDIKECAYSMINFFEKHTGILLNQDLSLWRCTRADVTLNYDLGGQIAVKQALDYMGYATTRGNNIEKRNSTRYWNKSSSLRSGKAYNKYEHAKKAMRSGKAFYTAEELSLVERLLRLELKLGRHWFQRQSKPWHKFKASELEAEHSKFFKDIIGSIEVPTMDTLIEKIREVAPSEGQARAAFHTYKDIQELGIQTVKETLPKTTFYRHRKILLDAGLSMADINAGRILEFRRKTIVLGNPVNDWVELKQVG